jgi:aryl-alcohol dehydrogenase-like predicted oxidoreductase
LDITLGNTGLKTHRISLGSVKFGRNTDVKYPEKFLIPNQKQVSNLISIAGEMGINLIDTAPAYGESEKKIGKAISKSRNKWIISTKVGEKYENKKSSFDFSRTGVWNSVHQSLNNLKTEVIDILLIHANDNELEIINNSDAVETLTDIKKKGLARNIGMSTKSPDGILAALEFSDIIMATLNLEDSSNLDAIKQAHKKGCGVLLKKIFASGKCQIKKSLEFVFKHELAHSAVIGTINKGHLAENVNLVSKLF